MELIRKNVHTDRICNTAVGRGVLEEEIPVHENAPEPEAVLRKKARLQIEEIRPGKDRVLVRGKVYCTLLCKAVGGASGLFCMDGTIPFEEQIYLEGTDEGSEIEAKGRIDDLRVTVSGKSKLTAQLVYEITVSGRALAELQLPIDADAGFTPPECRKERLKLTELKMMKKETLRVKEEVNLPGDFPCIKRILWKEADLREAEWKAVRGSIQLRGELAVYLLYEGEGTNEVKSFETTVSIRKNVECEEAAEGQIVDVDADLPLCEIQVRPDFDGEARVLGIELLTEPMLRLYEEVSEEVLTDVYSLTGELKPVYRSRTYSDIYMKVCGKTKVSHTLYLKNKKGNVLQFLNCSAEIHPEEEQVTDNGLLISGTVDVEALYRTDAEDMPYGSIGGRVPFSYLLETGGADENCKRKLECRVERLNMGIAGNPEEAEVRLSLAFCCVIFREKELELMETVECVETVPEKGKLPAMTIYVTEPGDTLWSIGKDYKIPVCKIAEVNKIPGEVSDCDTLHPGQKLLLMRI